MTLKITKIEILFLTLILVAGSVFRLYRISEYMTFLGDEGRDALAVRDIVLGKHFPLIGPGTSVGSMYLGPLYYYLVAPSLWLAGFSPVGLAGEVAVIGILTVALLWWIARSWFGPKIGLGISFLYAISPVVITYSRSSWNPNIMPFFALLAMYGTWLFWRRHDPRWLPVIGVCLAFVLNSHYLGLLLFPTVVIFLFLSKQLHKSYPLLLASVLIFILLMSPLVIFDMRHGWTNFHALVTFLTNRGNTVNLRIYKAMPNLWPIWNDLVSGLLTAQNYFLGWLLSLLLVFFTLIRLIKRQISSQFIFTLTWLGFGLLGLGLYKQHIYIHYYGFLFPVPFLLLGFWLQSFSRRLAAQAVSVVLFILLALVNLQHNPLKFAPNSQLVHTQKIAYFITDQTAGIPFNLALLSKNNYDAGYRYELALLNSSNVTIHEKLTDQLFVICEETPCHPVGNPLWEIAAFGWARIDKQWEFPWGVVVYRLVHNPTGS